MPTITTTLAGKDGAMNISSQIILPVHCDNLSGLYTFLSKMIYNCYLSMKGLHVPQQKQTF